MAQFTLELPDELLPALVAEFSLVKDFTEAETPEEYFAASVVETVRQRAELYKVGPYFEGPKEPQFNQDGTLFGVEEIEEDPEDNDTNGDPE
jgi:hypothetical protein